MNAGYYVGKWITKLIKRKGDGGAIKVVSAYTGTYIAKQVVKLVIAKAAGWKIGAALGSKLGYPQDLLYSKAHVQAFQPLLSAFS